MRPDLLLAMKSVAIELTDVVESSNIIFIEFAMYLRSLSTPRTHALFLLPHQSTHFQELKFLWRKHPSARSHHAFHVQKPTRIETSIRPPPSEQLLSSNDSKYWTRWSFATNGLGQLTQRNEHFVRTRSLDECRVGVRSRKVDFLSGNDRHCVVELMRVARCCVYVSTSAHFTFATKWCKSATLAY